MMILGSLIESAKTAIEQTKTSATKTQMREVFIRVPNRFSLLRSRRRIDVIRSRGSGNEISGVITAGQEETTAKSIYFFTLCNILRNGKERRRKVQRSALNESAQCTGRRRDKKAGAPKAPAVQLVCPDKTLETVLTKSR